MASEPQIDTVRTAGARKPAWLRFRGADARKFLQGQLSNDMITLTADRFALAGLHNPQGRVLAVLRLTAPEPDHIIAVLPAELADITMATLRRYVLRAKVTITQESTAPALPPLPGQALDIAAGIAQVYAATSSEFVAQMLNLDCVNAISFSKGCYTGQEIIARAHYRGRMKRRMQRFVTTSPVSLAPGQTVTLSDGRVAQIVDAVTLADGRTEFLAVTPLTATVSITGTVAEPNASLACSQLPLPYALPD